MATLVTEVINGERYDYYPLGEYVVRAVGVCGERPTFKHTRIEITGALERLASGESITCHLSPDNVPVTFGNRVPALCGNDVPASFGNRVPISG